MRGAVNFSWWRGQEWGECPFRSSWRFSLAAGWQEQNVGVTASPRPQTQGGISRVGLGHMSLMTALSWSGKACFIQRPGLGTQAPPAASRATPPGTAGGGLLRQVWQLVPCAQLGALPTRAGTPTCISAHWPHENLLAGDTDATRMSRTQLDRRLSCWDPWSRAEP